jgi:hypothetical protein
MVIVRPLVTTAKDTIAAWVTTLKLETTNRLLPGRVAGELTKACSIFTTPVSSGTDIGA